jgi:hypothetical protein
MSDHLQSKFTPLQSNFFPAKTPFSKIQKKILAGKKYFAKDRDPKIWTGI